MCCRCTRRYSSGNQQILINQVPSVWLFSDQNNIYRICINLHIGLIWIDHQSWFLMLNRFLPPCDPCDCRARAERTASPGFPLLVLRASVTRRAFGARLPVLDQNLIETIRKISMLKKKWKKINYFKHLYNICQHTTLWLCRGSHRITSHIALLFVDIYWESWRNFGTWCLAHDLKHM